MRDKFEEWYAKTFTVNMKMDLENCWETAYNQGLADGRAESKLMDRHTIETHVEKAVLDERDRIVKLLIKERAECKFINGVYWLKRIADLIERETE